MQNKQAIIGIVAAAIIILGAGAAYVYNKNFKKSTSSENSITAVKQEKKPSQTSSIIGLIGSQKTQKCTFSYDDQSSGKSSGTVYVDGNRMRLDLSLEKGNDKSSLNMIRNEDENYIWGSILPGETGIKMTLPLETLTTESSVEKYVNLNQDVDYKCVAWIKDNSLFELPKNIKFSDIGGFIKNTANTTNEKPSSQCGLCESLTDEAKTLCLKQFSC